MTNGRGRFVAKRPAKRDNVLIQSEIDFGGEGLSSAICRNVAGDKCPLSGGLYQPPAVLPSNGEKL